MRNFLLYISLIVFTTNAYSQSLEYDWVIYPSSDSAFSTYSYNIMTDDSGNLLMQLIYTSEDPLTYGNYVLPADNDYSSWTDEPSTDTSFIIKTTTNGNTIWDAPIYFKHAYIANITSQNNIQITPHTTVNTESFVFAGDTIHSFNYNTVTQTNPIHNILFNYNNNGGEEWAVFVSSSCTLSVFNDIVNSYDNIYFTPDFKKDIYYSDSLLYTTSDTYFNSAFVRIDTQGAIQTYKMLTGNGTGDSHIEISEIDNGDTLHCIITSYADTLYYYDGVQIATNNSGTMEAWLAKIDTDGNILSIVPLPMDMGAIANVIDGEYYTCRIFASPFITQGNDTLHNPSSGFALGIIKRNASLEPVWMTAYGNVSLNSEVKVNEIGFTFVSIINSDMYSPPGGEIIITPNDTIANLNSPIISVINTDGEILDTKILAPYSYIDGAGMMNLEVTNNNEIYFRGFQYLNHSDFTFNGDTITTPNNVDWCTFVFKMHLELPEITKQDIDLNQGWNLWSTYIEPDSPAIVSVLDPIVNQTQIAKNQYGQVYWPLYGLDMIGDIVIGQAYFTKVDTTLILQVAGVPVEPELTPIPLTQSWSLLGYLRQDTANVVSMLTSIAPNVIITKDDLGQVYWPLFGLNSIGVMEPGEGYQIKVAQPDTLVYPPN